MSVCTVSVGTVSVGTVSVGAQVLAGTFMQIRSTGSTIVDHGL